MFVSICAYCGKVRQLGRGFRSGGKTYCDSTCANSDSRTMTFAGMPSERIESRKHGGGGFLLTEDGDYILCEGLEFDGQRILVEGR